MRTLRLHLGLAIVFSVLTVVPAEKGDAAIIIIGGSLTGVTPSTIGSGSFDATHTSTVTNFAYPTGEFVTQQVQDAHVYGSTSSTGIAVSGNAQTIFGTTASGHFGPQAYGNANGTIGFDVTDPTLLSFSWSDGGGYASHSWLSISSAGNTALGCVGAGVGYNPYLGGCTLGSAPSATSHGPLDTQGTLTLTAGHYDLSFHVDSGVNTGTSDNGQFSFSIAATPVPLPATLPLLISALAVLGRVSRMREKREFGAAA